MENGLSMWVVPDNLRGHVLWFRADEVNDLAVVAGGFSHVVLEIPPILCYVAWIDDLVLQRDQGGLVRNVELGGTRQGGNESSSRCGLGRSFSISKVDLVSFV